MDASFAVYCTVPDSGVLCNRRDERLGAVEVWLEEGSLSISEPSLQQMQSLVNRFEGGSREEA